MRATAKGRLRGRQQAQRAPGSAPRRAAAPASTAPASLATVRRRTLHRLPSHRMRHPTPPARRLRRARSPHTSVAEQAADTPPSPSVLPLGWPGCSVVSALGTASHRPTERAVRSPRPCVAAAGCCLAAAAARSAGRSVRGPPAGRSYMWLEAFRGAIRGHPLSSLSDSYNALPGPGLVDDALLCRRRVGVPELTRVAQAETPLSRSSARTAMASNEVSPRRLLEVRLALSG
jgi:hypothetical protein